MPPMSAQSDGSSADPEQRYRVTVEVAGFPALWRVVAGMIRGLGPARNYSVEVEKV